MVNKHQKCAICRRYREEHNVIISSVPNAFLKVIPNIDPNIILTELALSFRKFIKKIYGEIKITYGGVALAY